MKKQNIQLILALTFLILIIILIILKPGELNRQRSVLGTFSRTFTSASAPGLSQQTSGTVEKITLGNGGWIISAGGVPASTHYARLRYKLPENEGMVFTYFYAKTTIILPPDFYSKQKASFRILNTDNFGTTLNGSPVGTNGGSELRVSVYLARDQKIQVQINHEGKTIESIYVAPSILPTGKHTFELSGDVANVAPWYFKIDGVLVASGVKRLSTDDTPLNERVITRLITGIDGAAGQDSNSVSLTVTEFTIANYDPHIVVVSSTPPMITNTPISPASSTSTNVPTSTSTIFSTFIPTITNTSTNTVTVTNTILPHTLTPTAYCVQALDVWVCDKYPR